VCRAFDITGTEHSRDHRHTEGPCASYLTGTRSSYTADPDDRDANQPRRVFKRVDAKWSTIPRLGGRLVNRSEDDVISSFAFSSHRFLDRVGGDPNQASHPENLPGRSDREAVGAQMHSGSVERQCDVDAVINQKLGSRGGRKLKHLLCKIEQVARRKIAFTYLNGEDAGCQCASQNSKQWTSTGLQTIRNKQEPARKGRH
jgi:hypothetical protein